MHLREGLQELLSRAGLTVVEEMRPGSLFPPEAAWRVARGITAPDGEAPDALDAPWWDRVVDADDEFLVAVHRYRIGGNDALWTRVRRTVAVPELTGGPGFVALALDGQVLLAEVPGPDGSRLTALDRLPERLEEVAGAAGRETEAERVAAWADVPARPGWPLHWAEGIGVNPAAPDDLLIRLLDVSDGFLYGCDRPAVLDAAVTHPDAKVRARSAEAFRPQLTPEQWIRLVRAEPSPALAVLLAERACALGVELPDDLYGDLLAGPCRAEAAALPSVPAGHLPALAADPDPRVRVTACARWEDLAQPVRDQLLADTQDLVRTEALLAHHTHGVPMPREVLNQLPEPRRALQQCCLSSELELHLVRDGDVETRRALAANVQLGAHAVAVLAQDPDDDVRSAVALRPDLTEEQRAAIRHDFDPRTVSYTVPWIASLHGDADAMRRLAASSHPLVRRSVARARRLPPDVVERLAHDEDRTVRLFLAESCDDAPAEMLLEVWRWWDGSFSHPGRPRTHPNFPRTGLLRFADDPSARMRRLALDDPRSTPADVARLARDPEAEARRRAAEDPRLTPADAVRLLDDPAHYVRATAMRNPRLPARVLAGLLHDRDTAHEAVTNPGIPVPVQYRILAAVAAAVAAL
ncbi:hypothetical protein [Streptomyces sp. NPDC048002]|uniref:hypothetical protein n=1 Tax=Streptomyces sp. NPDC048002 TaxID=3154344 RepID=UPI003407F472